MRRIPVSLVLALVAWLPVVHAEPADENVARCVPIDDPAARLACFDAATGRAGREVMQASTATGRAGPAPVAVSTPAAVAPSARAETFGLPAQPIADAPSRISAVVRSVDVHPHVGRWVVTLDNGQVWEQRESGAAAKRPRPGDEVTIEEASFGSYLMVAPGRGSNRVKRVR